MMQSRGATPLPAPSSPQCNDNSSTQLSTCCASEWPICCHLSRNSHLNINKEEAQLWWLIREGNMVVAMVEQQQKREPQEEKVRVSMRNSPRSFI
jgi:hypothetical protein